MKVSLAQRLGEIALTILIPLRIAMIIRGADLSDFDGVYFVFRQVVYTFAWLSIFMFLFESNFTDDDKSYSQKPKKMRIASLIAMICCGIKFIVTLVYQYPYVYLNALQLLYNIAELTAWFALTVFFFYFWKWRCTDETFWQP